MRLAPTIVALLAYVFVLAVATAPGTAPKRWGVFSFLLVALAIAYVLDEFHKRARR